MSADAWIECPFCAKPYKDKIVVLKEKLEEAYLSFIACDYDNFEKETNKKIKLIELDIEEHAWAQVFDVHEYFFNEEGELVTKIYVSCSTCSRLWQETVKTSPIIRDYKKEFGKKEE